MKNIFYVLFWIILILILSNCREGSVAAELPSSDNTVKYEVTGTTTNANVKYEEHGAIKENLNVSVPWSTEFITVSNIPLYLSAQSNLNTPLDSITETIYINGSPLITDTSTGAFATVIVNNKKVDKTQRSHAI